jgi:Protein of unknown function (DUF2911)
MKKNLTAFLFVAILFAACGDKAPETSGSDIIVTPAGDTTKIAIHNHNYSSNKYATVDVSPMDMSYYPVEYYKMNAAKQAESPLVVRVIYSRPHLTGRVLFKDVLKYGEPWRLGANESTEIEFFRDVAIQGKKIKKGRYILYSIPNEKTWVIVLNSNVDTWGLRQDTTKDLFRFEATAVKVDHHTEYFTMIFNESIHGADLIMAWGDLEISLPIEF